MSCPNASDRSRHRAYGACATVLLVVHAILLVWGASRHAPVVDEVGHLASGVGHWQTGRFDLYRVNPPLVRLVAGLPVALTGARFDWSRPRQSVWERPEFSIGRAFVEEYRQRSLWYFILARCACIPFSLFGGYICLRWATELYGASAGLLSLLLWCLSPNIIAFGQLIMPDVGAAALGITAAYCYWRWLRSPKWARALAAGVALGLCELTKMTWVVLVPLWPILWVAWAWSGAHHSVPQARRSQVIQLAVILLLGLYVVNAGYGFKGSFQRLGDYTFVSRTLAGPDSLVDAGRGGNRWAKTWLHRLPVPLPTDYVHGIDYQKSEFEHKKWSYLRGDWRRGGWWYYYLYALAVKVPLGTWTVLLTALLLSFSNRAHSVWPNELPLLSPLVVVLILVSSNTGINHHLRYVILVLPFAFVWVGKLAAIIEGRNCIAAVRLPLP